MPTLNALYSLNSTQNGLTLATAFPQTTGQGVGAQNLDLLQIVSKKGGTILLNVDSAGAVHNPASSPTNGTRIGQFATNFGTADSATTAQLFADAFENHDNSDIIQAVNAGGNIHYSLNYQGVASGS